MVRASLTECKAKKSTVPPKLSKKTADATGFLEPTVNRVVAEKRKLDTGPFPSSSKHYKKTRERVNVDDFDTDAICHTGHGFNERREYAMLDKLLQVLKRKGSMARATERPLSVGSGGSFCEWITQQPIQPHFPQKNRTSVM